MRERTCMYSDTTKPAPPLWKRRPVNRKISCKFPSTGTRKHFESCADPSYGPVRADNPFGNCATMYLTQWIAFSPLQSWPWSNRESSVPRPPGRQQARLLPSNVSCELSKGAPKSLKAWEKAGKCSYQISNLLSFDSNFRYEKLTLEW